MFYRTSKYWAKKIIIDGIKFDSQIEWRFYNYFKNHPSIKIIELQPKFCLLDSFKYDKRIIRGINYLADFKIDYNGDYFIIDVKWMETPAFKIKKKLFLKKHGGENVLLVVKSFKDFENQISNF